MKIKNLIVILACLIVSIGAYSQNPANRINNSEQYGYSAMDLRYGYSLYKYIFTVQGGLVIWQYSSPNGNTSGSFHCNSSISGNIITAECKGVVYWYFAGEFIYRMVEENNKFDSILYKWAIDALDSSMKEFEISKKTSVDAYNRVRDIYLEIKKAEDGRASRSLWDTLCYYSYIINEHKLKVADLYGYNF